MAASKVHFFFRCVAKDACGDIIDPRKEASISGLDDVFFCPNEDHVCCHKADVNLPKEPSKPKSCTDFSSSGYECTVRKFCREIDPRSDSNLEATNAECPGIRSSTNSENDMICCHKDYLIPKEEEKVRPTCNVFFRDGFSCAKSNECLDRIIGHGGEGLLVIRSGGQDFFSEGLVALILSRYFKSIIAL